MTENLTGTWNFPTRMLVGPGRIAELAQSCRACSIESPLVVTDQGLADLPVVAKAIKVLTGAGLSPDVFSDVKGNPTLDNVQAGLKAYRNGGHDGVVAIGGGSAMDVGKCVAFMARQTHSIWDFEEAGERWKQADAKAVAPVIAVPTAAGTGSEVARGAVVTNLATKEKRPIFHPKMMPKIVIADPELSVGLPPAMTAATGLDALTHCVEAYCAKGFHPMADGIALQGIALIARYLPRAFAKGDDIEARSRMLAAAAMGATAFQKGLGATHAISHPVNAFYDTHHGLTNAIVMPYVLLWNRPVIEHKMAILSRVLDLQPNLTQHGFDAVLGWLLDLRISLNIPNSLAELGVPEDRVEAMAEQAMRDPSAECNPRPMTQDDFARVIRAAICGDLTISGG
ncbi:dehydrogenase [Agaricicola taiwanensis]|uniref:Alcohol dehydrogenase 2 n=1 Tax=Agaricicola taiwanensis TaxID=591372 RepID=A0A8J2YFV8_9RHOB|nr:iron-containing alcohol dehydrogenase [Agaricicola taiwanensis]GGE30698.1 dehydrogenase [Agaricicola taiwanensis]